MKKATRMIWMEKQNTHVEEGTAMTTWASADETSYFNSTLFETDESFLSVSVTARFDAVVDYGSPASMLEAARKIYELAVLFLNEHKNLHTSFSDVHSNSVINSGANLVKENKVLENLISQDERYEDGYSVEQRIPNKQSCFLSKVTQKGQNHWHTHFNAEVREIVDARSIEQCEQVLSDIDAIAKIIHTSHLEMVKTGNELFGADFDYKGYEAAIEQAAQEMADRLQGEHL